MKVHNFTFIIITIVSTLIFMFVSWVAQEKIFYEVYNDTPNDVRISETVSSFGDFNYGYKITNNVNEAKLIFTENGSSYEKENFTVLEDGLYSPFVALIKYEFVKNHEDYQDYISINTSNSNKDVYYINLLPIFNSVLEGKTYKDINLGSSKEPIQIIIPDNSNSSYDELLEFIYLTFNNGKPLTQENIDTLKPTVNKFLSKVKKVKDISSYITKDTLKNNILILPEFNLRFTGSLEGISVCNVKDTNAIFYDVVIDNKIKDFFIKKDLSKKSFIEDTFFRNTHFNSKFSISNKNGYYVNIADFVSPIIMDENLKY